MIQIQFDSKTKNFDSNIQNLLKKSNIVDVKHCVQSVKQRLTPVWDLRDNVAVNPFFGFRDKNFLDTLCFHESLTGNSLLPSYKYFNSLYRSGKITDADLNLALIEYNNNFANTDKISLHDLKVALEIGLESDIVKINSGSDVYDLQNKTQWTPKVKKHISKWLSAYFDEGQSLWSMPTKNLRLFTAWKELVIYDKSFKKLGSKFNSTFFGLSDQPSEVIENLSEKLIQKFDLSSEQLEIYFFKLISQIQGWASFVQKFEFEAARKNQNDDLIRIGGFEDILAICLCYDYSFLNLVNFGPKFILINTSFDEIMTNDNVKKNILLKASEDNYRSQLLSKINVNTLTEKNNFPEAQMAFCIDVRSELIRRHIENLCPQIQTIGFAGFFGISMSHRTLGASHAEQQCPVLLNPVCEIQEISKSKHLGIKIKNKIKNINFLKFLKSGVNSSFTFVETFGWTYIFKMIKSNHFKCKINLSFEPLIIKSSKDNQRRPDLTSLSLDQKTKLAFGALKNMGLTSNFAPFVFFMGHKSKTENNPQSSALDCGACAGHSGLSNARTLAGLLNDLGLREELKMNYKIDIPLNSCFISGVHITTTDDFEFDEYHITDASTLKSFYSLKNKLKFAQIKTLKERSKNFNYCENLSDKDLIEQIQNKSNDWSEVQPEWALANNAAFIAARRELTRGLDLNGRTFLHNYDAKKDLDLSILELIMTAPMIVANWINMQYYVSAVNPKDYGSDDKTLHNIVGQIGLIRGNGSDLLMGLSLQSLFRNGQLMHQPLRLQVILEAATKDMDQIILKHKMVKDLVENEWLNLISICPDFGSKKIYCKGEWVQLN